MERPITNLDLKIFDPQQGPEKLKTFAFETGLFPMDSPSVKALVQAAQVKEPEYFITKTGKKIQERASKAVYESIEKTYGLMEGSGKGFWERQWDVSRRQVQTLVDSFTPDDTSVFGFLDDVATTPTPAEAIRYLSSEDTDPRLKFEVTRQAGLSLVAAELETRSRSAKERLKEVQEWLNIDIFNDKTHPPKIQDIWALHKNDTNETIWIDMSSEDHEDYEDAHWKKHQQRMRYAGPEIGWVMINGRIKEAGANKTVKKAVLRDKEGKDSTLDPHNDVPDLMGIQFVVKDELYHDGPKVKAFKKRVQEVLAKRVKEKGEMEGRSLTIEFREKNGTTGDRTKSGKYQGDRDMAYEIEELENGEFEEIDPPLELMFHGQEDHFRNNHHIGETDEQTNKPTGAAHKIMEADRALLIMKAAYFPTFPPDAPDDEKFYGNPDWNATRRGVFTAIEKRLRNANLPAENKNNDQAQPTGEVVVYQAK